MRAFNSGGGSKAFAGRCRNVNGIVAMIMNCLSVAPQEAYYLTCFRKKIDKIKKFILRFLKMIF
jgi:hypothetical protein